MNNIGRPRNQWRDAYTKRFGLSKRKRRNLEARVLEQLELCGDDDARRVLLGIRTRRKK